MNDFIRPRIIPGLACLGSVILCLVYAKFRTTMPEWWAMNGGGIPYVLFWILLWYCFFPARKHILIICVGVVAFTCLLEFGQLWNPEPIASFRETTFGKALLGNTFVWADMPPYFIGGLIGFLCLLALSIFQPTSSNTEKFAEELAEESTR